MKELEISSFARESSVRAGHLVGADALLFVEPEKTLLHLRLVETHRGEIISDAVYPLDPLDIEAIANATKAQLDGLARKLRTPPANRIYVALGPIAAFGKNAAFAETLGTLSTLIGVRLIQHAPLILVERDNLATILAEKNIAGASPAGLASADWIVRGRVIAADPRQLSLEFQIQSTRGAAGSVFTANVGRATLARDADAIGTKVATALGLAAPAGGVNLAVEAQRHYLSGLALLHAQLFEPALRSLETACLLDRENEKYARAFFDGVALCIRERVGGNIQSASAVPAAEYAFYVDRLRAATVVARNHAPSAAALLADGRRVCSFLAVQNARLDSDDRALVAACRQELREFFERFCADAKNAESKRLLGDYAPIFFEEPRAALEYFKRIVAAGGYPWSGLREHVFPRIDYWDKELAWKLWSGFLDEVERDPSPEKQFSAVAARCFYDEVFPSAYSQGVRGKGRASAQRLFAWLAAREENLQWVLAHENGYIFLRLWHAMHSLPIEEQDRYFETVMLKVLAKAQGSETKAFYYLQVRAAGRKDDRQPREDGPQLRKMTEAALATLQSANPKLHTEVLANLATQDWYAALMKSPLKSETPMPDVPGGVLLYDSARTEPPTRTFDSFNGLVEGDVLWLAHPKPKAIVVTRVEMSRRTSETFEFPVEASGQSAFEHLVLARSARFLFVADKYRVLAIPVAAKAPFLSVSSYETVGPKFGADETAGTLARDIGSGRDSGFRRITAVVPGGDALYVALDQRTHDGSNRYGAIYRWRPGARECELVCASSSLKPGPLNDCLPYSVAGGCAAPDGSALWFFLAEVPRQPAAFAEGQRWGAWKLTPASGQWERFREGRFGSLQRRPMFVSKPIFAVPADAGGNDRLNLQTLEMVHAAGDISGEDARRGWEAKLEVESGVRYERLYRVEGDQRTRLLSLNAREYDIGSLIPTGQGLAVLLAGLQPGGNKPTTRGLVYLLPQER